ncbi:MAG: L,D-transpeptidase family protein [Actinomycetota bacterium]
MTNGTHAKRRLSALVIIVGVFLVLGLAAGGVAFAAYRYDRANHDKILPGVRVAGVDVGGLTRTEALAAVQQAVSERLHTPITITAGDKTWTTSAAALGQGVNVEGAVDRAEAVSDQMSWVDRVWHRVRHVPVDVDISVGSHGSPSSVHTLVTKIAGATDVMSRDASVNLVGFSDVTFVRARGGVEVDQKAALRSIRAALARGETEVTLPVHEVKPKVTDGKLGVTVVVRIDQNRLFLYRGFKQIRTYQVATAMPGFTTPVGEWTIVDKQENPTWHNPALDGWGAGEPAVIGPGPDNPLGTRALYLDAPGIRIHGTPAAYSIGTYASHGCIRMTISDSEALYPLVPVGARVIIAGVRPV